jgi:hypothetical protein
MTASVVRTVAAGDPDCLHCAIMRAIAAHLAGRGITAVAVADALCDVIAETVGHHPDAAAADAVIAAISALAAAKTAQWRAHLAAAAERAPAGATLQ